MAWLLLRGNNLAQALPTAAARLAHVLGLRSAAIEMEAIEGDEHRRIAFPLREGTRRLGTLLVGADTPEASLRRLQERVVPALEALLSAALERDALLGRSSRRPHCGARTSSRRPCCARSPTICACP
ncbi:MAG TPA: hypothetical protein VGI24_08405 [Solirubrobacteraceae bacterium]|jgi:two-component system sensor histidine kinase KdpD